jgi:hypothetical protein
MRSCVWTALLRCIPPEHHNVLMLVTRCGTEIALQNILHVNDEILAIKGRLAGSQDAGRLYFVPLDNIDYFGFNRMVKDDEFVALFGDMPAPPLAAPLAPAAVAAPAAPPAPPETPAPVSPSNVDPPAPPEPPPTNTTPSPGTPLRATLPIKSAVLERFRARAAGATMNGIAKPPSE